MSLDLIHTLARWHGLVAWLFTATLLTTAIALAGDRARRFATWLGVITAALGIAAGGLGFAIHDAYRARLRQRLFLQAPNIGWLFERKLHLAVGAVLLAIAAAAITLAARRDEARALRKAAAIAWTAAGLLALAAAVASTVVAARMRF